jgi:hypothetical protein
VPYDGLDTSLLVTLKSTVIGVAWAAAAPNSSPTVRAAAWNLRVMRISVLGLNRDRELTRQAAGNRLIEVLRARQRNEEVEM